LVFRFGSRSLNVGIQDAGQAGQPCQARPVQAGVRLVVFQAGGDGAFQARSRVDAEVQGLLVFQRVV
jgi:hypothetical protein